ncbi:hypothetical protein E4U21_005582 [Claviceps maximensis]|nr:hypothetical protein E4U21_005582 [Claviceps maximensis]
MSGDQDKFGPGAPVSGVSGSHLLQPQAQQQADPSAVKLTRGTSCVLCQQRKVRCDKKKPCAGCVKIGVDCKVVPPLPPRRKKRRLQEKDLIDRLRKYEALLTENGIKYDAIGHDSRSEGHHNEDVDELENDFEGLKATPGSHTSSSNNTRKADNEQLLHNSSEDEEEKCNIHRAYDQMFTNDDGFPFVFSGRQLSTTHCHPSPVHIFQLWQIYIDNVNTLLKITHVPSVQAQIIQASSDLANAPKNIEALMFAFYAISIQSMEEMDVQKMFGDSKRAVMGRFLAALQQALLNADFMRMNDLISLQAYVLYLVRSMILSICSLARRDNCTQKKNCLPVITILIELTNLSMQFVIRWTIDPRQVFCLIGIAVRIAQRMGLHQDPAGYGLAPFEVEQRRRLWWTIVSHDRRIAEITGSTVTALSSGSNCKLPLNVNDSDLHIDGTELPKPHNGPTEMLFALTRLEIAMAVASDSDGHSAKINPERASPSSSVSFSCQKDPLPSVRVAGQDSTPYTFDGFCAHMEDRYLRHCDPKIPLHFFTITMTRQTLSKMRVMIYLMRTYNREHVLDETERESLFLLSIQVVEYDNVVHASESLKPFRWFTAHHFPFPAYMFLVQELRQRCRGHAVDRAWEAISPNHYLRDMAQNIHSPMYTAFGRHLTKAWDAYSEACVASGRDAPVVPFFVALLRQRMEINHREKRQDADSATPSAQFDMTESRWGASTHTNVLLTSPTSVGPSPQWSNGSSAPVDVGMSSGIGPNQNVFDMDWSYLVSDFSPSMGSASGFQGFLNLAHFGPGPPGLGHRNGELSPAVAGNGGGGAAAAAHGSGGTF